MAMATASASAMSETDIYAKLETLGTAYQVLRHKAITTMDEGKEIMTQLQGCVPANLFLRDKSGVFYLLVKNMGTKIKFSDLEKTIGTTKLSMVKSNVMTDILSVPAGCVSVFALENKSAEKVIVLIDDSIDKSSKINFHPLVNSATVTIDYVSMIEFIKSCGNAYLIVGLK